MLFDTHCHLDRFPNPMAVAAEAEHGGVVVFGMTTLPAHFELGIEHVRQFKRIRLALGLHPLLAAKHRDAVESFRKLVCRTSYIGEVGLDFSREGASSRKEQLEVFEVVLDAVAHRPGFLSIHSRRAEKEVLAALRAKGASRAVFHWYTGPASTASAILDEGHYFSVNPAMIRTASGQELIGRLPRERILTETDGPYVRVDGTPAHPWHVRLVVDYLANAWHVQAPEAEAQVEANVRGILSWLQPSSLPVNEQDGHKDR